QDDQQQTGLEQATTVKDPVEKGLLGNHIRRSPDDADSLRSHFNFHDGDRIDTAYESRKSR
ncbi:MAG: hypothetical protein RBT16_10825, partial [Desulfococcus multivorans]|nr:hypothetical protein [Desulfococcus multivorans]